MCTISQWIKDGEVLKGEWDLYHLNDMLASLPVDWLGPTYYFSSNISVAGTFLALGTMDERTSHKTVYELNSCFKLHQVSPADPRQPHQWMNTSGVWAQYFCGKFYSLVHLSYGLTNGTTPYLQIISISYDECRSSGITLVWFLRNQFQLDLLRLEN